MKALDVYFPRSADLARVLAFLAPGTNPDGPPRLQAPVSGLVVTALPGTGLTSFLLSELMHAPYVRRRPAEFASPEAYGLEGDPQECLEMLAAADDAAAVEGPAVLVVDQLDRLPPIAQVDLLDRLERGVSRNPMLQFVLGVAGEPSPELASALERRGSIARLALPPLGHDFVESLALYLAEDTNLVLDPGALAAVFRSSRFQPARLKAAIREMVHGGHQDLASAAVAVGIELQEGL